MEFETDGDRSSSRSRILEGAMDAMAKHGVRKVTIEDICADAGVSKRTIYRYFQGRSDIIAALTEHVSTEFSIGLERAIRQTPALEQRVELIMNVLLTHATSSATARLIEAEAEFIRTSLNERYDGYIEVVRRAVEPIFADRPDLAAAGLFDRDLAQIIMRLAVDALIFPQHASRKVAGIVARYWRLMDAAARFGSEISRK